MTRTQKEIGAAARALDEEVRRALASANAAVEHRRVALKEECALQGHVKHHTEHNMMRTRSWSVCGYCGAQFDERDI